MAYNKPTIIDERFQVHIDPKSKDQGKQICEEYFALINNSGAQVLYNQLNIKDIFFMSMDVPNSFSISKRQLTEFQKLYGSSLTFKDRDTLIICGGIIDESDVVTSACYEYSIESNKVTTLPDMIAPRYNFAICYQDNKIYVFGGGYIENFNYNLSKHCEYFDYATKKWIEMADLNRCQAGGSVINYKDEFWLIGGGIFDSNGYLIERYIKNKNSWEIVNINFNVNSVKYPCFLLSPCENEILIRYDNGYRNLIYKLNLMDHTILVIPEFANIDREPREVLPIDERKMIVIYRNYYKEAGFALYDVKEGILFDHFPFPIYDYIPPVNFTRVCQRIVTVPYSYTPCPQDLGQDYSSINLIFGNIYTPFQLEINSYTCKMEIYPVRTDLVLHKCDQIYRISNNELFIFRNGHLNKQSIIYSLNSKTHKKLPIPFCLNVSKMCYFKNYIYVVKNKDYSNVECNRQTQRYNLITDEWEFIEKINCKYNIYMLMPGQSKLYAIGKENNEYRDFICVFNEGKKRWEFCNFPYSNFTVYLYPDYYSDDLILYRNSAEKNEVYLYNASKGDLATPLFLTGKQKPIKYPFGIINIADTYIRFGTDDIYDSIAFQFLDPHKDEYIASHGLENINWSDFKIRFNKFADLVPRPDSGHKWYVLHYNNRKEA